MFKLNLKAKAGGTALQGHFKVPYSVLEKNFGPGDTRSGDNKIHIEWIFEDKDLDTVVTLYEYKNIKPAGDAMSLAILKNQSTFEWNIGAKSRAVAQLFAGWLRNQLNDGTFRGSSK